MLNPNLRRFSKQALSAHPEHDREHEPDVQLELKNVAGSQPRSDALGVVGTIAQYAVGTTRFVKAFHRSDTGALWPNGSGLVNHCTAT